MTKYTLHVLNVQKKKIVCEVNPTKKRGRPFGTTKKPNNIQNKKDPEAKEEGHIFDHHQHLNIPKTMENSSPKLAKTILGTFTDPNKNTVHNDRVVFLNGGPQNNIYQPQIYSNPHINSNMINVGHFNNNNTNTNYLNIPNNPITNLPVHPKININKPTDIIKPNSPTSTEQKSTNFVSWGNNSNIEVNSALFPFQTNLSFLALASKENNDIPNVPNNFKKEQENTNDLVDSFLSNPKD